jgi:hypothetical protein
MWLHCNLQVHSRIRSGFSNESQCNECLSGKEIQQLSLNCILAMMGLQVINIIR